MRAVAATSTSGLDSGSFIDHLHVYVYLSSISTRSKLLTIGIEALRTLVEQGPMPAAHGVVRWRLVDLAQILFEDHGVSVSEQTLSRAMRAMGYVKLSARPRHHAQDPDAIPAFKKPSPTAWRKSPGLRAASR